MNLSKMQKRYIWLAGSFPQLAVVQGHGYRIPRTMFTVDYEIGELTIYGYGNPLYFLEHRHLFKKMQTHGLYTLTEIGENEFNKMLIKGDGEFLNRETREIQKKIIK